MESVNSTQPLAPAAYVAATNSVDISELAAVAARTFALACPPAVAPDDVASFVEANLSAARFAEYLSDPHRAVLAARHDGRIVGYAMLVRGDTGDTVELSKMYVVADHHGGGASRALMNLALATADEWGAHRVWLGVNQANHRAQRFYAKHGFAVSGTRTFRVGARQENDYVMVRERR